MSARHFTWSARAGVVLGAGAFGLWFGEGLRGAPALPEGLVALGACVAGCAIPAGRQASRLAMAAVSFCSIGVGWWLGQTEASAAFNECVQSGEIVREALADTKTRTGSYPSTLEELGGALPCRRTLRGTLLTYSRTADGYSLKFSDWFMTHEATQEHAFVGHK